jgi:hypothetical protein
MKRLEPIMVGVFIAILLQGCKTYNTLQSLGSKSPIDPKLPALEKSIDFKGGGLFYGNSDQYEIFDQEVENNLCNPYGQKFGYIILRTYYSKYKLGLGYSVASGLTLLIPNLLGLPLARPKFEVQATIEILNSRKELIGKYKASGEGKSIMALYYGYSQSDAIRKARNEALNNALEGIRNQIKSDVPRLMDEFRKANKLAGEDMPPK